MNAQAALKGQYHAAPAMLKQANNIRHIQHHAALLAGRLRRATGVDVQWMGFE
jgi:hypothetical protein